MALDHTQHSIRLPQQILSQLNRGDGNARRPKIFSIASRRKQARKSRRAGKKAVSSQSAKGLASAHKTQPMRSALREDDSKKAALRDQKLAETSNSKSPDMELDHSNFSVSQKSSVSPEPDDNLHLSRATRQKLEEDDAQIAALERKLGKRKGTNSGMKTLLADIGELGGLSGSEGETDLVPNKRKRDPDYQEWLQSKRQKATDVQNASIPDSHGYDEFDEFEGFESSGSAAGSKQLKTHRENPYVAPSSNKYVPPYARNQTLTNMDLGPDQAASQQLRRRIQGLLNRLSEANMLEITKSVNQLLNENSRHSVSSILIDLLLTLLADATVLNDTFVILHAGFIAALYQTIGIDFGAKLVQSLVERLRVQEFEAGLESAGKERANLISLLSELYNFRVISSKLIYGLIRIFIAKLNENSAELLLKIVRNSGQQLRQDDPSSLTDVVILLQESSKRIGEANLTVRAKFMIETINELKNNRLKTGAQSANLRVEHLSRMKKTLTLMSSSTGVQKRAVEPLRVTLSDIRDSQSRGKWWLVGASYRDEAQVRDLHDHGASGDNKSHDGKRNEVGSRKSAINDSEDSVALDLSVMTKSLGMNTDIRRAIFVAIMTAATVEEAYTRVLKLSLNKRQMPEVSVVLTRCVAAERLYNPFYKVLARKLASTREVRKALWVPFLEITSRLSNDDDDGDEHEGSRSSWWSDTQARYNIACFYGALIADGTISIAIMKGQNLLHSSKAHETFIEVLLVKLFASVRKSRKQLRNVFVVEALSENLNITNSLIKFINTHVRRSDLAGPEEKKIVRWCADTVCDLLHDLVLRA